MENNENDYESYFRNEFQKMDQNRDGLISYQDLMKLMKKCGYKCTEAELQDYVNEVEINERGEIGQEAFLDIISKCQEENDNQNELFELFCMFDKDKTKLLTIKNVKEIFSKIDENIKDEEILLIFKENDLDKDGYLNFDEFCRMVKNK